MIFQRRVTDRIKNPQFLCLTHQKGDYFRKIFYLFRRLRNDRHARAELDVLQLLRIHDHEYARFCVGFHPLYLGMVFIAEDHDIIALRAHLFYDLLRLSHEGAGSVDELLVLRF